MKKRIMLKLSGQALSNGTDTYDKESLRNITSQIKILKEKYDCEVLIVIGGGNIIRGHLSTKIGLGDDRTFADYLGMQATVINAFALQRVLTTINVESVIYNSLNYWFIHSNLNKEKIKTDILNKIILIFSGGTGKPHVTTDTATVLIALENNCDVILVGKNGVDGIYNKDPKKHDDAIFIPNITVNEYLKKDLKIFDREAVEALRDSKKELDVIFFELTKKNSIVNAINNKLERKTTLR